MKKIFTLFLCFTAVLMACQKEVPDPAAPTTPIKFTFSTTAVNVNKGGESVQITIRRLGDPFEGTVTLEPVIDGIANPANPSDYFIDPMVLTFGGEYNEEVVTITTTDNDYRVTGNKQFKLRMKSASNSGVGLSATDVTVTIREVNEASIEFSADEIELEEGGTAYSLVLTRTGLDYAGTVSLQAVTTGFTNYAEAGIDYTLSTTNVVFHYGETSKTVTIVPRAEDGEYTGDTYFTLKAVSASPAIGLEETTAKIIIQETSMSLEDHLLSSGWQAFYYDDLDDDFAYMDIAFTPTGQPGIYTLNITEGELDIDLKVSFTGNTMKIILPQYGGMYYGEFARYTGLLWKGSNPEAVPVTFTAPFGKTRAGNGYIANPPTGLGFTLDGGIDGLAVPLYSIPENGNIVDHLLLWEAVSIAKYGF